MPVVIFELSTKEEKLTYQSYKPLLLLCLFWLHEKCNLSSNECLLIQMWQKLEYLSVVFQTLQENNYARNFQTYIMHSVTQGRCLACFWAVLKLGIFMASLREFF